MQPITVGDLEPGDVAGAHRVLATAFAGEPFAVGMFGDRIDDRVAGMGRLYADWPWSSPVVAVARQGGTVVGVAQGTLPGRCHLCTDAPEDEPEPTDHAERIDREFQRACAEAHRRAQLPTSHGHIVTVATDPGRHGQGIGRLVVADLRERMVGAGAACLVLECLRSRETFYRSLGFRAVDEFDDPAAPGLGCLLMRADLA